MAVVRSRLLGCCTVAACCLCGTRPAVAPRGGVFHFAGSGVDAANDAVRVRRILAAVSIGSLAERGETGVNEQN
jgi:hypothetical protein